MTRGELRRWTNERPDDAWCSREIVAYQLTRLQMYERNDARKRRQRVRGRGTARGLALAKSAILRFVMTSPMYTRVRRPEARA